MAFILGKASQAEIDRLKQQGYEVEIGPFVGMEGFYGTEHEQTDPDTGGEDLKDIRVFVDADVVDIVSR